MAAAAARVALASRCPAQFFTVRGVTFEGRQELVQQLQPGQPLLLVREPSNPHDAGAVAVRTLHGDAVGFIARELTAVLPLPACTGRVMSIGLATSSGGAFGVRLACCPSLHGLAACIELPPRAWHTATDLQQQVGMELWAQLLRTSVVRWRQRCALTGAPLGAVLAPEQLLPLWTFDAHARCVRLCDLLPVCSPLAALRETVAAGAFADSDAALELATNLTGWSADELHDYVKYARTQAYTAETSDWQLDMPLDAQGLMGLAATGCRATSQGHLPSAELMLSDDADSAATAGTAAAPTNL